MSYTIYFEQVGETPNEGQWGEIEEAANKICVKHNKILCREFD